MKILITGTTGYLGHEIAMTLAKKNISVHAMVRDTESSRVPKHQNITLFKGNLENRQDIENAMRGCSHVIHSAAFTNMRSKNIDLFYNTNVVGTDNVLKNAQKLGVERFVFTSSLSVFGPSLEEVPITETQPRLTSYSNAYELTKSMAEELVRNYNDQGLPSIILNVSKIYGPGLKSFSNGINRLIELCSESPFLIIPDKTQVVSNYVYIEDVIQAHIASLSKGKPGENYIIGGENVSYEELFHNIKSMTQSRTKIMKVNFTLSRFAISIMDKLKSLYGSESSIGPEVIDALFTYRVSTSEKAVRDLDYQYVPLEKGLQNTLEYLKTQ